MVEPQIVVLAVAGSSPVGHPFWELPIADLRFSIAILHRAFSIGSRKSAFENSSVPVAQPDRASDFGSEGWGFESLQARFFIFRADVRISCCLAA
jgi:hypothetical protein